MKSSILSGIKYLEVVAPTGKVGSPSAAVRQNGQVVFSVTGAKLINFPTRTYFRAGTDEEGNIYLVPAKETDKNVIKATKNNESMQFRQDNVFADLGANYKDRYGVTEHHEGEGENTITYFKLTKKSAAEAKAEESAEKPAPKPSKSEAEIKGAMARKTELIKKESEAAALKAAKADFKKSK